MFCYSYAFPLPFGTKLKLLSIWWWSRNLERNRVKLSRKYGKIGGNESCFEMFAIILGCNARSKDGRERERKLEMNFLF